MFSPQQHSRIQNYTSVLDHLKGALKSMHALSIGDVRRAVTSWFSFEGGDVYTPDEPITFELAVRSDLDETQLTSLDATVTIEHRETDSVVDQHQVTVDRTHRTVECAPLSTPGVYTISITAPGAAPVSDVFAVLADEPES